MTTDKNMNTDKNKNDLQADKARQSSSMNSPKPADKRAEKSSRDDNSYKDVDRERHPEEQVVKQSEYKKDEQKFNDQSKRS